MKTASATRCLLLLALLTGCGRATEAAAPSSAAPPAVPGNAALDGAASAEAEQGEPATLAEAEALLEKARADLARLASNEPGGGAPLESAAPPPAPASAPRQSEEKRAEAAADSAPVKKDASACETACKAFSSLERASDAVCRLDTGGTGQRCERARQIRQDAARRVASCGCSR